MAMNLTELDAHEQPSAHMRAEWKQFSRQDAAALESESRIDDPRAPLQDAGFVVAGSLAQEQISSSFAQLAPELSSFAQGDVPILHHPLLPGLLIMPSLLPPPVQVTLLDRMIHRDLSNPIHQTNMHLHYDIPYPSLANRSVHQDSNEASFFSLSPDSPPSFIPKDPSTHKPLTVSQVLNRRLHWVTFGGQYDWTSRVYPDERPPEFPPDLARFLKDLFPETQAQAAILNFYTPGDTMMMHRDVSEETDKGLISLSFGCDCLFMISPSNLHADGETDALDGGKGYLILRLRSGDAIYMTKESRYAWHGVPKVVKGTCPDYLRSWPTRPDENASFGDWEDWMANKRVNLNVRQMRD